MISVLLAMAVSLVIAAILGFVLALADKFLRVEDDHRIEEVTKMLPGANCGGCGFPGCVGLATSIIEKKTDSVSACRAAKPEAKKAIQEYLAKTPGPDGEVLNIKA